MLYNSLRKILRTNKIVIDDSAEEQKRISKVVESIVKVQNKLVTQSKSSHITSLLHEMNKEIKESIGGAISEDTEKLLNQFNSNFESIENNFNALKERIDELESKLV